MFYQTWKKYVPLITLFVKKSANGPQRVQLNTLDFERALGGRKMKLSFARMEINRGRFNSLLKNTVLARDLAQALLDDVALSNLLRSRQMSFAFTGGHELLITDETPVAIVPEAEADEATVETLEPQEAELTAAE